MACGSRCACWQVEGQLSRNPGETPFRLARLPWPPPESIRARVNARCPLACVPAPKMVPPSTIHGEELAFVCTHEPMCSSILSCRCMPACRSSMSRHLQRAGSSTSQHQRAGSSYIAVSSVPATQPPSQYKPTHPCRPDRRVSIMQRASIDLRVSTGCDLSKPAQSMGRHRRCSGN